MDQELISFSLLTEIKEKQFGLQCENSMNRVEACSKNYQSQSTRARYIRLLMSLKVHYSVAGTFLMSQYRRNDFNINIFCKSANFPLNIENYIPKFDEFTNYLQKIKYNDKSKVDYFTFSVFPSIFNFFINSPRFDLKLLQTTIREIFKKDSALLYDISRAFYVSPEFITYSHDVLQPIFSYFQSHFDEIKKQSLTNIKSTLLALLNKEYSNPNFIESPRFVSHSLLSCKDSFEMFKQAFLKVAFQNKETLMFYGLFHYSRPPTNEQFKILKNTFDTEEEEMSLKCQTMLMNIIIKNENIDNSFLKEKFIKFDSFKEYSKVIVTHNDIQFFNSTKDLSTFTFHPTSELFFCSDEITQDLMNPENESLETEDYFELKESCDYFFKNTNQSMFDQKGSMAAYLRHLLQYTDPIPEITEESIAKNNLTLNTFIDEILVLRGPIESISKRRFYAYNLREFFLFQSRKQKNAEEILKPILDKIIIKNPNEIKLYTKYYIESNQMDKIENQIQKGLSIAKLISSFIDPNNKIMKIPIYHSNYLKNPLNIYNDFVNYEKKTKDLPIDDKNLLILLRLFDQDNINLYQVFLKKELEGKKIQQQENSQLFQLSLIEEFSNSKIKHFVSNYLFKEGEIYIHKLNEAFEDTSIFRMIELVNELLEDILIKYDKLPDPDEKSNIKAISIVYSRPKYLQIINNFCRTYLFQFRESSNNTSDILFQLCSFVQDINISYKFYQKIIEKMAIRSH